MSFRIQYQSPDHLRYENGLHVSGPHKGGAIRLIEVEPNESGESEFLVTIYIIDKEGNVSIQMSTKQMNGVSANEEKVALRGVGYDELGNSFSDYALSADFERGVVINCTLHLLDRNVDIQYLKDKTDEKPSEKIEGRDIKEFKSFIEKWNRSLTMNDKIKIAGASDLINNNGVNFKNNGNYTKAIDSFINALKVMPINDDSLFNLKSCYEIMNYSKYSIRKIEKKLEYLENLGM